MCTHKLEVNLLHQFKKLENITIGDNFDNIFNKHDQQLILETIATHQKTSIDISMILHMQHNLIFCKTLCSSELYLFYPIVLPTTSFTIESSIIYTSVSE